MNAFSGPQPLVFPPRAVSTAANQPLPVMSSALNPAALQTAFFDNPPLTPESLNKAFEQHKNPKKEKHLPWEWLGLAGLTSLGMFNPLLIVPITYKVANNFVFSFCGQDLVGMGLPRVGQSLLRDAEIYEPEKDPKAQRLKGLPKTLYIKTQQAKHANWVNLYEEIMREIASGPGLLAWGTVGTLAFKASGRFTGLPEGRRCFELPLAQVKALEGSFQTYLQGQGQPNPKHPKALIQGFYEQLFHPAKAPLTGEALLEKPLTLKLDLRQAASHPDFTLSPKNLRSLAANDVDGLAAELGAFAKQPNLFKRLPKQAPIARQTTLKQLVTHWAEALADNTLLELKGAKRNVFNKENLALRAKINYYSQAVEQAVIQLNHGQPQAHRFAYNAWPIKLADKATQAFAVGDREGLLGQADKFSDMIASALRRSQKAEQLGQKLPLAQASKQVLNHVAKLGVVKTVSFTAMTFWWMWYLAHEIQKGRRYPARRFNPDSVSNQALLNPAPKVEKPIASTSFASSSFKPASAGFVPTGFTAAPIKPAFLKPALFSPQQQPKLTEGQA
jgi:hypothetical protein